MFVPQLMEDFELGPLRKYTPCSFSDVGEQQEALAVTHAELILIHPFREGNGRSARLLATLMGLQAGLPLLRFDAMDGAAKQRYIAAIHEAQGNNYQPMREIFGEIIRQTWALETGR
jgi:cell filamentation protein